MASKKVDQTYESLFTFSDINVYDILTASFAYLLHPGSYPNRDNLPIKSFPRNGI